MAASGHSSNNTTTLAAPGNQCTGQQLGGDGKAVSSPGICGRSIPDPARLNELYGQVVRLMGPGESFGEVALLQKSATRTATVVASPAPPAPLETAKILQAVESAEEQDCHNKQRDAQGVQHTNQQSISSRVSKDQVPELQGNTAAADTVGIELIRLSRSCYDATVRAVQVGSALPHMKSGGGLLPNQLQRAHQVDNV